MACRPVRVCYRAGCAGARRRLCGGRDANQAGLAPQLPGDRAFPLCVRAAGTVFSPVLLRHGSRGNAVQPRPAVVGLSRGEESRQHRRLRLHPRSAAGGHGLVRQHALPHAERGCGAAARSDDRARVRAALRDAFDFQHFGHELRRDFETRRAGAVQRREIGGLLDEYRRGRPDAVASGRRRRYRVPDRHGEIRRARRGRAARRRPPARDRRPSPGSDVRDQAVAGRQAGQGRHSARRQGHAGNRRHPPYSRRRRRDQSQPPSRHRQRRGTA